MFILFSLVIVIIFLSSVRFRHTPFGGIDFRLSTNIKCILMLVILMAHAGQRTLEFYTLLPLEYPIERFYSAVAGVVCCSTFFLLSGYGLTISVIDKENYLQNFLKKRLLKILIPYFIAIAVTIGIRSLYLNHSFVSIVQNLPALLASGATIVDFSWFIDQILVFYVIFYLCCRFLQLRYALLAVCGCTAAMAFLMLSAHWATWRICPILAFPVGTVLAYGFSTRWSITKTFLCALSTITLLQISIYLPFGTAGCKSLPLYLLCIVFPNLFALLVAFLCSFLSGKHTRFLDFLSSFYFEAYLFQFIGTSYLLWGIRDEPYLYVSGVMVCAILSGYIAHLISARILRCIG